MDIITKRIVTNGKRKAKLAKLGACERREQIKRYIMAECVALKVKLDAVTMRRMVACVSDRLHKMEAGV